MYQEITDNCFYSSFAIARKSEAGHEANVLLGIYSPWGTFRIFKGVLKVKLSWKENVCTVGGFGNRIMI